MATESPIRMIGGSGKWPSRKEITAYGQSSANIGIEDLGLLLNGQRYQENRSKLAPSRSGSAPPSIEGSFSAIRNLILQQDFAADSNLASLNSKKYESEEQLRADPSYFEYYSSHVNLNPRLPPPIISWENRHLVRHLGSNNGNAVKLTSFDDSAKSTLRMSRSSLFTHKEEPEDDYSQIQAPNDHLDRTGGILSGPIEASAGQLKNASDFVQGFTGAPSHVYNPNRSSGHEFVEEATNQDASTTSVDDSAQLSHSDPPTASVSSSSSLDGKGDAPYNTSFSRKSSIDTGGHLQVGVNTSDIEAGIASINISSITKSENHKSERDWQQNYQSNALIHQVQGPHSSMISQGIGHGYVGMNQVLHVPSNFYAEVQPIHQPSGLTAPPLATAAYMTSQNPLYPNMQQPVFYSQQYSVGYAFNATAVSPLVPGQLPQGVDMQQWSNFYGFPGLPMQSSYADPFHVQPAQQHFGEAYSVAGQFDYSAVRNAAPGSQSGHSNLNASVGMASPYHFGRPAHMHNFHYPPQGFVRPAFPGSSLARVTFPGGIKEVNTSPSPVRHSGIYVGWQSPSRYEASHDARTITFLEELKAGKGRRFQLSDIAGHIVEFSADQHGSRFIQQKLENCSAEEKAAVFKEILPHASKLMTDVFGNYVIQKFFEYGNAEQRMQLGQQLEGQILPLSLQMYGCRVIQKALDAIELEQKAKLVHELDGHVLRCVRDQNGNHVIQKCIESIPTEKIKFIIASFRGQVAALSMHPYGCRVIQRVLEHSTDELQSQFIVDEILESVYALAQDQYGNYVTQHVLERGKPHERSQIISKLEGQVVQLSQHKFASNVIEKCLEHGDFASREILIGEIIGLHDGTDNLLAMVKDQFANYVVQKILQVCTSDQRELLLGRIRIHLNSLKKYTYGKHIVARFEQLYGEELQTPGSGEG